MEFSLRRVPCLSLLVASSLLSLAVVQGCFNYVCSDTYKQCTKKSGDNVFINSNACAGKGWYFEAMKMLLTQNLKINFLNVCRWWRVLHFWGWLRVSLHEKDRKQIPHVLIPWLQMHFRWYHVSMHFWTQIVSGFKWDQLKTKNSCKMDGICAGV
jgi:hypothetical protein